MAVERTRPEASQGGSNEYHAANLAFSRASIVSGAAAGEPILDRLRAYEDDVREAERQRVRAALVDYAVSHSQGATNLMLRAWLEAVDAT